MHNFAGAVQKDNRARAKRRISSPYADDFAQRQHLEVKMRYPVGCIY